MKIASKQHTLEKLWLFDCEWYGRSVSLIGPVLKKQTKTTSYNLDETDVFFSNALQPNLETVTGQMRNYSHTSLLVFHLFLCRETHQYIYPMTWVPLLCRGSLET